MWPAFIGTISRPLGGSDHEISYLHSTILVLQKMACISETRRRQQNFFFWLRFWDTGHFLKSQNWTMQIWYLMIGGSQRSGNGTNECRSHGIPLNDTPHAILHVKINPSSKPPKVYLEDRSGLDRVIHVRIEWNFQYWFIRLFWACCH